MAAIPDEFTVTLSREHVNIILGFLWHAEEHFVTRDAVKAYMTADALVSKVAKSGFAPKRPHPEQVAQARKLGERRRFFCRRKE